MAVPLGEADTRGSVYRGLDNARSREGVSMTHENEHGLQSQIIAYCDLKRVGWIRLNSISRGFVRGYYWRDLFGKKRSSGASDVIVFKDGRAVFLECKRNEKAKSNAKTEDAQELFRSWCRFYEMEIYRVDSFDVGKKIIDGLCE